MPVLKIQTNVESETGYEADLLQLASRTTAQILNKSERYVMVSLEHNPFMAFGGTQQAMAYVELKSIGLPRDETKALSAALTQMINSSLHIPADRIYIEFADAERPMFGWNGGTF